MNGRGWFQLVALTLLLAGCSASAATYDGVDLEGQVTVGGAPLASGGIQFLPETVAQGPAVGGEIVDGAYRAADVPLGRVRVVVGAIRKTRELPPDEYGMIHWETENLVPPERREGLVVEIVADQQKLDLAW